MLHMELLRPPMLLFTTRMLSLLLDPDLSLYLEQEGMLLDKVVLVKDQVKYQSLVVHKAVVHKVHEVGTEADVKISEHIIDAHKVPDVLNYDICPYGPFG